MRHHPARPRVAINADRVAGASEAVKAVVRLKAGAMAATANLIACCKAEHGCIKTPRSIDDVTSFPKSANPSFKEQCDAIAA